MDPWHERSLKHLRSHFNKSRSMNILRLMIIRVTFIPEILDGAQVCNKPGTSIRKLFSTPRFPDIYVTVRKYRIFSPACGLPYLLTSVQSQFYNDPPSWKEKTPRGLRHGVGVPGSSTKALRLLTKRRTPRAAAWCRRSRQLN